MTGSLGGGVGGGMLATYLTCNVLFGIETAGTSLLWCGIVAGVGGSYVGGKYLGDGTGWLGGKIYETTVR